MRLVTVQETLVGWEKNRISGMLAINLHLFFGMLMIRGCVFEKIIRVISLIILQAAVQILLRIFSVADALINSKS
jgi:hypothetical protein